MQVHFNLRRRPHFLQAAAAMETVYFPPSRFSGRPIAPKRQTRSPMEKPEGWASVHGKHEWRIESLQVVCFANTKSEARVRLAKAYGAKLPVGVVITKVV